MLYKQAIQFKEKGAVSAVTLLVERQEEHLTRKN